MRRCDGSGSGSGSAGLVSTVDDYLTFARMLLNGGVHKGRHLLSAESVRGMTRNHLTPAQKSASWTRRLFSWSVRRCRVTRLCLSGAIA